MHGGSLHSELSLRRAEGAPLGPLWDAFGAPVGASLGLLWGSFGAPFGAPTGLLWGSVGAPSGLRWGSNRGGSFGAPTGRLNKEKIIIEYLYV